SSSLNGGVILKDASTITEQYNKDQTKGWMANNTSGSIMDSRGRIWTLTANGPCIRYPDHHVVPLLNGPLFKVSAICELKQGSLVLSPDGGGLSITHETSRDQFTIEPLLTVDGSKQYTYLYTHADGRVFGAANLSILDIYDPSSEFRLIHSFPLHAITLCMVPMDQADQVWIGTDHGVSIFNTQSNHLEKAEWTNFLSGLMVNGIVPENDSIVWLSTNQGIYRLETRSHTYMTFDLSNGLGSMTFNSNAFLKRKNGEIWFAGQDGITVVEVSKEVKDVPLRHIAFSKILVNDLESEQLSCTRTKATNVGVFQSIRLPFRDNTLSFEFVAFDYGGPGHPQYEYRMAGLDKDWIISDHGGFARYPNIKAGKYVFQVRAKNGTQPGYSPVRSLDIQIIAPLYQRPWFIALLVFLAGTFLFWLNQLNERRKRKMQKLVYEKKLELEAERLRISNDMHDDLGSGLSALHLRTKLLADQIQDPAIKEQMQEVNAGADRLTQQIRETIWTINSRNDTIDSLVTRLHQYAIEYFDGSGIQCTVDLMPEQNLTPILGKVRRDIFLAYKEALHNIYKHAGATEVRIRLFVNEGNQLVIDIRDNGHGFDTEAGSTGLGLKSMRRRIEDLGGRFELNSGKSGTRISINYLYTRN
ncbi:MAG TPA: triple tyrosine motif-containing protein, partial [Saprospiraceae bacterium]|nr:triple tyrosine motif-containing protein [Saprospiraceae bacterium]